MKNLPERLKIGTCSWKYDSWKGLVYSDDVGENHLREYSRKYKLVEVDQWFWSLFGRNVVMPKPEVVREYVSSVPRDFRFSIKIPNSITLTHQYQKGKKGPLEPNPHFLSNELFGDFLSLLQPMAKQIDSLIFQFEYLNKQKMPSQLEFQNKLYGFFLGCSPDYPYCIEIRNQNYLNRPYFEFLQDLGLSHVFLQGYWMPPIFEIYGRFKKHIEKQVLIRLLGPDRKSIEKQTKNQWNQIVESKDGELHKLKIMIQDLLSKGINVTLSVNNHYEGSAPLTIERFLRIFLGDLY